MSRDRTRGTLRRKGKSANRASANATLYAANDESVKSVLVSKSIIRFFGTNGYTFHVISWEE